MKEKTNERNALAELAERLDKGRWNLDVKDYDKAVLIIAELAKVSDWHWKVFCDDFCTAGEFELHRAIGKCLAIAEEGVSNGK